MRLLWIDARAWLRPGRTRNAAAAVLFGARLWRCCLVAGAGLISSAPAWCQRIEPPKPTGREAAVSAADSTALSGVSGVDVAASRSEAVDRLRTLETPSAQSTSGTTGAALAAPSTGAGSPQVAGTAQSAAAAQTRSPAIERTADKSLRAVLNERLRHIEEFERLTLALQQAINPDPNPEMQL